MNLNEIFKSEIKKRFDSIENVLSNESYEFEKEALADLHSLKGDLSYAGDLEAIEDLYHLTQKIKKCFKSKDGFSVCLNDARDLRLRVEGLTPLGSLKGLDALKVILEGSARNISRRLKKEIKFAFLAQDMKLSIDQVLFLKQALLPLVMNACVHGTEEGGSVSVEIEILEGRSLKTRVTDSGGDFDGKEAKLFAGEGIGVAFVRALVEGKGGKFFLEDLPTSGLRACVDIDLERAQL